MNISNSLWILQRPVLSTWTKIKPLNTSNTHKTCNIALMYLIYNQEQFRQSFLLVTKPQGSSTSKTLQI